MEADDPCYVCRKVKNNRIESRFGYVYCEDHENVPPVYLEEIKKKYFWENNMTERVPFIVLGREIGTATGWDQVTDWGLFLYNFIPNEQYKKLPTSDINFDFQSGKIETFNDVGEVVISLDMIETLTI